MKILLVEDDAVGARVAAECLSHRGHEVHGVDCGNDAIGALHGADFDAAVVDVGLPDRDGFTVVEKLCRLQPRLRCVLVTGQFIADAEQRARALGAHFRTKPLDFADLEELLDDRS